MITIALDLRSASTDRPVDESSSNSRYKNIRVPASRRTCRLGIKEQTCR